MSSPQKQPESAVSRPVIVGITGASGVSIGVRVLELLKSVNESSHLILTPAAERTLAYETQLKISAVKKLATVVHPHTDIGASIASGSFHAKGMIVAPCSVKSMSEIATGITANLLSRAADVTLKERRPLVLMVRESPLHLGHLRTMASLTEMGAIIAPPMPAFYAGPQDINDLVTQMAARALKLLGIECPELKVWGETVKPSRPGKPKT